MICFDRVDKNYNSRPALNGLSFKFNLEKWCSSPAIQVQENLRY